MTGMANVDIHKNLPGSRLRAANTAQQQPLTARPMGELKASSRFRAYIFDPVSRMVPIIFGTVIAAAIIYGWNTRGEEYLTAESGVGYWLGIAGAVMMLMLLLYPLRKRFNSMRIIGTVAGWFRLHMLLGLLGPLLILFHANFKLGSLNSAVALLSMLSVAISGLIGRYLYARIHRGLYGKKVELRDILEDADALKAVFGEDLSHAPAIIELLAQFEQKVFQKRQNFIISLAAAISIGRRSKQCRRQLLRRARSIINRNARAQGLSWWQKRQHMRDVKYHLDMYFKAVRKAARLALFERLFGLWHILHLPLFIMLVLAAVVHIIAVHLY